MPQDTLQHVHCLPFRGWPLAAADAEDGIDPTLHLGEAVLLVRARLKLDAEMSDQTILASLRAIAVGATPRERWLAAFNSTLGAWLALRGADLNTTLSTVIALVPRPTS